MYSPFYIAEQKMLFPHRSIVRTVAEVQDRLIELVAQGITTEEQVRTTPIGRLIRYYFPCIDQWTMLEALEKPIYINTLGDITDTLIN